MVENCSPNSAQEAMREHDEDSKFFLQLRLLLYQVQAHEVPKPGVKEDRRLDLERASAKLAQSARSRGSLQILAR